MAYNYEYPYVDPNRYNSDWLLNEIKKIWETIKKYPPVPTPDKMFINVREHGALGDGVTDDTVAIQSIINNAGEYTRIYFPTGKYLLKSTITINKPVYLYGDGFGQTSNNTNGQDNGATTIIFKTQTNGFVINSGNYIFNVTISDMEIVGSNVCTNGISLYSGVMCNLLNLHIRECQNSGILITNNIDYLCQFNRICNYDYVYGASSATENSAALKISGNADRLVTQNYIENIRSLCKNNAIVLSNTDNNVFTKCFGYSINYKMLLLTDNANNNYFDYITGQVEQKNSFGNVLNHWTSEGAVMKMNGTNPIAYNLVDYVTGESFKTDFYWMSKKISYGAGDITHDSNVNSYISSDGITCLRLAAGSSIGISQKFHNFNNGTITTAAIYYFASTAATNTLEWTYNRIADLHSLNEHKTSGTTTLTVTVPNAMYRAIVPLGQIIEKNEFITFSLKSNTDSNISIIGIDIEYVSAGPHSAGSGPFDVPKLENIHTN
nr:MAG TPA: Pectate lyase [Caudoviricetes sp.]